MPSNIRTITSLQNPQVKNLVKLRGRRARNAQGLQIIEEPLVIRRAMAGGIVFRTVFFCPEQLTDPAAETLLADLRQSPPPSLEFVRLTPRLMTKVSYRAHPAGLLVLAQQTRRQLTDLKLSSRPLLVVLVGVRKPGNLGAILRIADGAGADAVISCVPGPDPSNPNVMRTSRGTCFTLPMTIAPKEEIETFQIRSG